MDSEESTFTPIQFTTPYMPNKERFHSLINQIFCSKKLTNNGPLVHSLEKRLKQFLQVKNILLVSSGTFALQLALKLFNIQGEVITTPFSFFATSSALLWQGITPIYADICAKSFNLNPSNIESLITEKTTAILPVHIFGNPCDTNAIKRLAQHYQLPVIYDAAHCFGINKLGSQVLNQGDISILSFHATKLFHTIEGGALIINDDSLFQRAKKMINFGINDAGIIDEIGINGKMSEIHAAMGHCVLDDIDELLQRRSKQVQFYKRRLKAKVHFQEHHLTKELSYYMPVLLNNKNDCAQLHDQLNSKGIHCKRYFHPSLDSIRLYNHKPNCPISHDIASRILCLPLFHDLTVDCQKQICDLIYHRSLSTID